MLVLIAALSSNIVLAAPTVTETEEQRRRAQQEAAERQRREQQKDVFMQKEKKHAEDTSLPEESPSFVVNTLKVEGERVDQFPWVQAMLDKYKGRHIGIQGINLIVKRLTNAFIDRGYVTTRVLVPEQNLSSGTLRLVIVPGVIREIRFQDPKLWGSWRTAFPARPGNILNLRDLEQGLEQMKRMPSQDVDMQIVPGAKPGESDIVIAVKRDKPWKVVLSLDDSGSKATGKLQASQTFSVDNLFGINDLFNVSFSGDADQRGQILGSRGDSIYYSFPSGNSTFSISGSRYRYYQTIDSSIQPFVYSGESENLEFRVSQLLSRDQTRKTHLEFSVIKKKTGDLKADGSVIAADNVQVKTAGDLTNAGVIKATDSVKVEAVNVANAGGAIEAGNSVNLTAVQDIANLSGTIKGEQVDLTGDVNLAAGNNVKITTAQENSQEEHYRYEKTTGIFGSGVGITIGSKSEKNTLDGQAVIQVGSTVASLDGKVTVAAGKDAGITGSIITSARGIDVTGQNVSIDSATNTFSSTQTYEFKQSGLSVSLGGGVVATGMNLAYDVRRAGQVSDGRLAALYGYKAFDEFKKLNKQFNGELKNDVAISVSLGSQRSSWEAVSTATFAQGSTLASAGNVNITATGSGATDAAGKAADGSVNVVGSGVSGENVTLTAVKDVNLVAADNTSATTTSSSSSSSGIGVSFNYKSGDMLGVFVQGSKASGNEDGAGTTHTETGVTANDTLTVKTGSDANIVGAQAKGDTVKMEIGGDLNIASQQDTDSYHERTSSAGGTIGLGSGVSSSVSASKGKIDSDYRSVQEQSGIYVGQGGFDIAVGGNTDLKGAVIASDATPDKNKLSTGTLTWSDVENKAEYSASGNGISLSTDLIKDGKPNLDDNNAYKAGTDGSANGVTRSAVASGTIEIKNSESQTQDVNTLSRDTKNANGSIAPIFDKKKVQEELEFQKVLTEVFTDELYKASKNNGSKNFSVDLSKALEGKVTFKKDDGTEIIVDIKAIAAATGDNITDVAKFVKDNLDQFTFAAGATVIVVGGVLFTVTNVNGKYTVSGTSSGRMDLQLFAKKADIKQIENVAQEFKMSPEIRRAFGDYVESLKKDIPNNVNFTYKQLQQIAKEFLGVE